MALWKPFRGSRLTLDTVEKHDGYVYFCTDDGSLFFDYVGSDGNLQRKQINAKDAETLTGMSLEQIQNSISWDNLLNKPVDISNSNTLTWDGDRTRQEVAYDMYFKISDATPAISELNNGYSMTLSLGDIYSTDQNNCVIQDTGNGVVTLSGDTDIPFAIIAYETNTDVQSGTYFLNTNAVIDEGYYLSVLTINGYNGFTKETIREDYIPNTIARVSDIPEQVQSDWSVNDEINPAYVKNRPFYHSENAVLYDSTITTSDMGGIYAYMDQSDGAKATSSLIEGETYTVTFDNDIYTCICSNGTHIGDLSLVGAGDATNEPFVIFVYTGTCVGIATKDVNSATHTVKIEGSVIKTIDVKYLPELPYITLQEGNQQWVTKSNFAQTNSNLTYRGKTYSTNHEYFMYFLTAEGIWQISLVVYNSAQIPASSSFRMNYASSDGTLSFYWSNTSNTTEITTVMHAYLCDVNTGSIIRRETNVQSVTIGAYTKKSHNFDFYIDKSNPQDAEIVRSFDDYIDVNAEIATLNESIESKADIEHGHSEKMDINNPTGVGSFSLNRKADTTIGDYSFAEGQRAEASGPYSHAEGYSTRAIASAAHAEGNGTQATGLNSHAEGDSTIASGASAHSEGFATETRANYAHAQGMGTIAGSAIQHVEGKYNIVDSAKKYAHIVGNGESDSARSNAHTLDWSGNAWFAGDVYVGGTKQDDGDKLVKQSELPQPLVGDTTSITPTQVKQALDEGRAIALSHTDTTYGNMSFNCFAYSQAASATVISSTTFEMMGYSFCAQVIGSLVNDTWAFSAIQLAKKSDIPTKLANPNALTINGTEYDGSSAVNMKTAFYVNITPSDDGEICTTDKTFDEINAAWEAGYPVYANYNGIASMPLVTIEDGMASFMFTMSENNSVVTLMIAVAGSTAVQMFMEDNIPTSTSDLTNDSGFITENDLPTKTSDLTNDSGFLTKVKTSDIEALAVTGPRIANGAVGLSKLEEPIQTAITNTVTTNNKLNTLIGDDTDKSVRDIAAEELAAQLIPENANASRDTLEEIAAWIQQHPDDAAAMNKSIDDLESYVEELDYATFPLIQSGAFMTHEAISTDGSTYTVEIYGFTNNMLSQWASMGLNFVIVPNMTSTTTAPKLLLNGHEIQIKRRLSNSSSVVDGASAGWLVANVPVRVLFDGTYWIAEGFEKPMASDLEGNLSISQISNLQNTLKDIVHYIVGDSTEAGVWTGTCEDITEYYDGLMISYKTNIAGISGGTTLNINGLGSVAVVRNTTSAITTHYGVGSILMLTYTVDSSGTAYWKLADYDSDTKTRSSNKAATKMYLIGAQTQSTSGQTTYSNNKCYIGTNNRLYSNGEVVPSVAEITALIQEQIGVIENGTY